MTILSKEEQRLFFEQLEARFNEHVSRHPSIQWEEVAVKLESDTGKLWSLYQMETTGGEPDVVGIDEITGGIVFFDCSAESPTKRRHLCYDQAALEARKANKPKGSAIEMANEMGITMLTEIQYRMLQTLGTFDLKTSSWVKTPDRIRVLGGAIFCDRRYDTVFTYHNGADSYYAARGFRGMLVI
ncbi:DUF4256 domain-containing protein [Fusibacter paucivorans]|uniref:DUF4256 domain-containing protein n=1 Tax=Fusibacter paucivorans TaxID=76009 RepID=A0ABS5PNW7_9FIRM|nr:DUF4256 domain-containing protein [Fusibacter paucivorans]MBS7526860.1 DUF4256 domain-containing protein [Fusibacter paucivorans]